MSQLIRTQGYDSVIWKTLARRAPHHCPECDGHRTLHYIGFAENYLHGMHGRLYVCSDCGNWLDCVWPKDINQSLQEFDLAAIVVEAGQPVKTAPLAAATAV